MARLMVQSVFHVPPADRDPVDLGMDGDRCDPVGWLKAKAADVGRDRPTMWTAFL